MSINVGSNSEAVLRRGLIDITDDLGDVEAKPFKSFLEADISKYNLDISDDELPASAETGERLPDLYDFIHSIRDEDTDLDKDREPPSLFNRPEHLEKYKNISALKYQVRDAAVNEYVSNFDSEVKDNLLMIANVSLEDVQSEEMRMKREYMQHHKEQQEKHNRKKKEIAEMEQSTRKRFLSENKEKRKQLEKMVELARQKKKLQLVLLHRAFDRSEKQLQQALERRKEEVKKMFGVLYEAQNGVSGGQGKRWKLDWNQAPQPIEVKIKSLRGIRDKLPGGRYVLLVSQYNRLGGHVLRWSTVKNQMWGGTTIPVHHEGHFYNGEIKVNQSLFTVLPSKPSIRPGMMITFELYLLRGSFLNTDRCVAWGCFPICDGEFEVIEGKYKTAMIRGEMDFKLDKHSQFERIIASDLDHWLCNAYFEIVKLPRFVKDQKEYEVELQFSSGLINYPERIHTDGEDYKDSEGPVLGSAYSSSVNLAESYSMSEVTTQKSSSEASYKQKLTSDNSDTFSSVTEPDDVPLQSAIANKQQLEEDNNSDSGISMDDEETKSSEEKFVAVEADPGLYFKRHLSNPADVYTKKLYSMMPKSSESAQKVQKRKLTYAEELELHTPSVKPAFSEKGRLAEKGWKRLSYTVRMFLSELGLSQWRSRELWAMLFLFVFTFFMRIFLHYSAQYIFLYSLRIPINSFNFLPYTVHLNYQPSLLDVLEETFVVFLGPLFILSLFVLTVILCWFCQGCFGIFPDLGSKFVLMFGIQAVFDPIFILIVDLAQQNYDYKTMSPSKPVADFAKLYWFFERTQGSGVGGVFITFFLYILIMFASVSILYMYFLRLHNNGRMIDIYWRLHSETEQIFIPYDMEVSIQELEYVLNKAEQWRGEEGERRKVAVYDYIWEEEDNFTEESAVMKRKEKTTHIAIHTLHLDGMRELYRHFLVLPDGAIVEVFEELSYVPGLSKDIKKAINQGAHKVENLHSPRAAYVMEKVKKLSKADNSRSSITSLSTKAMNDGEISVKTEITNVHSVDMDRRKKSD